SMAGVGDDDRAGTAANVRAEQVVLDRIGEPDDLGAGERAELERFTHAALASTPWPAAYRWWSSSPGQRNAAPHPHRNFSSTLRESPASRSASRSMSTL